jgi:hypothetical protein
MTDQIQVDSDGMTWIRLPFVYYNPEELARVEREGGRIDEKCMYTSDEYKPPKKGFKLHPAHKQHLAPGEPHKSLWVLPYEGE